MTLIFNRLLEVVEVRVPAKFRERFMSYRVNGESDDADSNTAVASAGSKNGCRRLQARFTGASSPVRRRLIVFQT